MQFLMFCAVLGFLMFEDSGGSPWAERRPEGYEGSQFARRGPDDLEIGEMLPMHDMVAKMQMQFLQNMIATDLQQFHGGGEFSIFFQFSFNFFQLLKLFF